MQLSERCYCPQVSDDRNEASLIFVIVALVHTIEKEDKRAQEVRLFFSTLAGGSNIGIQI